MFDEQVVRRDARLREVMEKFVCVRLIQANGLDLSLFQFDFDLTFAAFFLNADRTIYGRFGSRSTRAEAAGEISLEGFRKAMEGALDLHRAFPANRAALAGKTGSSPRFPVPEEYPSLRGKYAAKLDYEGKVVQSCIHCHQVREGERMVFRADKKPVPDEVLFPWPMPDVVGLRFDPTERARIKTVERGSAADRAGWKAGDEILSLEGQPMLSLADVQWVLHQAGSTARLQAQIRRAGRTLPLNLPLPEGWRRGGDLSWRASTWDLRRMATGGLVLKELAAAKRRDLQLTDTQLGLVVDYVGLYGAHAAGKKAGFLKDDVLLSVDGRSDRLSESGLLGFLLQKRMPGETVPVKVWRAGERLSLELPMQ